MTGIIVEGLCIFGMNIVLMTAGITLFDWQWWACMVCLLVYGVCALIRGMED